MTDSIQTTPTGTKVIIALLAAILLLIGGFMASQTSQDRAALEQQENRASLGAFGDCLAVAALRLGHPDLRAALDADTAEFRAASTTCHAETQ